MQKLFCRRGRSNPYDDIVSKIKKGGGEGVTGFNCQQTPCRNISLHPSSACVTHSRSIDRYFINTLQ